MPAKRATAAPRRTLDTQGHRGARGLLPENTLPAFARALEIGVATLELDCGVTRDGVVVVSHDSRLNPDITRDASGAWIDAPGPVIYELDHRELARYDVGRIRPGSAYSRRFPQQAPVDGSAIPRLEDVFAFVRSAGDKLVRFNIETKISPLAPELAPAPEDFVRVLLDVIERAGMSQRVSIQSFDWRTLRIVQGKTPSMPTVYLTAESLAPHTVRADAASAWTAGYDPRDFGGSVPRAIAAAGGRAWSPAYEDVSRERVDEAHAVGLEVVVWTVNDECDMRRLIDWGVDGIISDYPDVLCAIARSSAT